MAVQGDQQATATVNTHTHCGRGRTCSRQLQHLLLIQSYQLLSREMAQRYPSTSMEELVKEKVEEELENLTSSGRDPIKGNKTVNEVVTAIMPGIASIISVAVTTAVSSVVKDITDKLLLNTQKVNLQHRYDIDRLEQYTRKDNLPFFGIEEEADEDEDILQAKVMEVAAQVGVKLEADDISIAHRLGKVGENSRPVIVRFVHRKKRNAVVKNKKEHRRKFISMKT